MNSDAKLSVILKRVQEMRAAGLSTRKMAETLESEGFQPAGRGKKWNHTAVRWYLAQLDAPAKAEHAPDPAPHPSLTIEIHGPYTPADRLLWTFLVNQAGDELAENKVHTIPLPVVYEALKVGEGSPTRRHLCEVLQRLTATRIFWDGKLPPLRNSTSVTLLTGQVVDEEKVLAFHFSPFLVKLLRNRQQKARLQLLLESKKR